MVDRNHSKPGRFPKLTTTARATVLAALLSPGDSIDTVGMFATGTVGLHTVMRALVRRYRWPIIRDDMATKTGWATTWTLAPAVIDAALDAAGREWLGGVKAARSKRRMAFIR